mmetsp:Transcript_32158/g.31909  ORF Transcript_32158/g.31909 Transcript_32158/m.31909 type:complete len:125 (+) Transcript_32158:14-388(+)
MEYAYSVIAGLYNSRAISIHEEEILKEMVEKNDPAIMRILSKHDPASNLEEIQSEFIRLAKQKQKPGEVYIPPRNMLDEMTSPLDNYLLERKKRLKPEDGDGFTIGSPNLIKIEEATENISEEN